MMNASDPSMLRPLTAQEQIYWLLNWNSPIHPVLAAHVAGPTTPGQWREALDQLQQRHPLLSVSIEAPSSAPGRSQPFFKQRWGPQIPLRVAEHNAGRWEAEVEQELAVPFGPGSAPLMRASLLHQSGRSVIILAASHSIVDGNSLVLLLRDLLTAISGRLLEPLPFPRSAEEMLDPAPSGPDHAWNGEDLGSAPVNAGGRPVCRKFRDQPLAH